MFFLIWLAQPREGMGTGAPQPRAGRNSRLGKDPGDLEPPSPCSREGGDAGDSPMGRGGGLPLTCHDAKMASFLFIRLEAVRTLRVVFPPPPWHSSLPNSEAEGRERIILIREKNESNGPSYSPAHIIEMNDQGLLINLICC